MPPPPKLPAPVAELPEITQSLSVRTFPMAPETIPPPPTPVDSVPPVIVTPEILVTKFASRNGLTSITLSPGCVCRIIVVADPAPTIAVLLPVISRSPIESSPLKPSPAPDIVKLYVPAGMLIVVPGFRFANAIAPRRLQSLGAGVRAQAANVPSVRPAVMAPSGVIGLPRGPPHRSANARHRRAR